MGRESGKGDEGKARQLETHLATKQNRVLRSSAEKANSTQRLLIGSKLQRLHELHGLVLQEYCPLCSSTRRGRTVHRLLRWKQRGL